MSRTVWNVCGWAGLAVAVTLIVRGLGADPPAGVVGGDPQCPACRRFMNPSPCREARPRP